jgi:hypothetical protein
MDDELELSDRTKVEQEAGRKQAALNAAKFEAAVRAREAENAPKPDNGEAQVAVDEALQRAEKSKPQKGAKS